jgi:ketosteroid isomerase-like protein
MQPQTPREVAQAFFDRNAAGDIDGALALLHDDATWWNLGSTRFSGSFAGKDAILSGLVGPLFAELRAGISSHVDAIIADDQHAVVLSRGQAETQSGVPYNNTYAQVFTVRDGQIVAVREYMDTALVDAVFGPAG